MHNCILLLFVYFFFFFFSLFKELVRLNNKGQLTAEDLKKNNVECKRLEADKSDQSKMSPEEIGAKFGFQIINSKSFDENNKDEELFIYLTLLDTQIRIDLTPIVEQFFISFHAEDEEEKNMTNSK